jgi:hypothetical protein
MTSFIQTYSPKSAINNPSDIMTQEAYSNTLDRGLQSAIMRKFETPKAGMQFYREMSVDYPTITMGSFRSAGGYVPQSRDTDELAMVARGDGFTYVLQTFDYQQGISLEVKLQEIDDRGLTSGLQTDLADNVAKTIEAICAHPINTALGTSGSSVLADDGMYLVDSARPNANAAAGTWSNLESTSDISETSLFTAVLAAQQSTDENGNLFEADVKKVVIRPNERRDLWVVLNSQGKVGSSVNDANWASSFFNMDNVIVYPYMTTKQILYLLCDPKSMDNELLFVTRKPMETYTFQGDTPRVLKQMVYFSVGVGLGSPRKFIRGGAVS